MNRNYSYRLYPSRTQKLSLATVLEIHRTVYNDALTERRLAWQMCQKSVNYYAQANQLKAIREFDKEIASLNFDSTQQTLRRLNKAFDAFFRRIKAGENPGYPRYKSRQHFNSFSFVWNNGARLFHNRLRLQGIGDVKVKWHRSIPEDANIKQCVIKRKAGQRWFVIFMLELPDSPQIENRGDAIC